MTIDDGFAAVQEIPEKKVRNYGQRNRKLSRETSTKMVNILCKNGDNDGDENNSNGLSTLPIYIAVYFELYIFWYVICRAPRR